MPKPKPNIVIVGPVTPQTGGMETYIRELLESKISDTFNLRLFDISKPYVRRKQSKKYTGYSASLRRNIFVTIQSYFLSFFFLVKFVYHMSKQRADIVHIHTASFTSFWEKVFYIYICKWMHIPVILHIHGAMFETFYYRQPLAVRKFITHVLLLCDHIIVLSEYWYKFLTRITNSSVLSIVPNGVNTKEFAENKYEKSEFPSLLFLSELAKRKGIYDLLKIIVPLKESIPDLLVYVAGPGDLSELQQLSREYNVDNVIYFMGPVFNREKLQLLQSSWVFILPSYAEAQPMSVIEAMSSGTAIVSTDVGGLPEMVTEKTNGYLAKPGDIDAFVSVLQKLLTDKSLCISIGKNNIEKAQKIYNINKNMKLLDECYQEMLNGKLV